jgi:hypothetical protein
LRERQGSRGPPKQIPRLRKVAAEAWLHSAPSHGTACSPQFPPPLAANSKSLAGLSKTRQRPAMKPRLITGELTMPNHDVTVLPRKLKPPRDANALGEMLETFSRGRKR